MSSVTPVAPITPIASSASVAQASRAANRSRYARVALATVVAAVVANAIVYFIGAALVGYDPQFIVLGNVTGVGIFTLVPAIVAALLYALLLRVSRHPAGVFTIIAAAVFVVTLIPDFTYIPSLPGATVGQTAVLVLMHAVAATVIVGMLTALTRPQPQPDTTATTPRG